MFVLSLVFAACQDTPAGAAALPPTHGQAAVPAPATPSPFALPSGAGAVTPSFTHDGADLLYVWQEPESVAVGSHAEVTRRVRFARRHAGAWSAPVDLARGTDILVNWANFPAVGAAADGTLMAHWFRPTSDSYEFSMVRSADRGATWTPLPAPFTAGLSGERGFVSYVAEPDGLRVLWLDGREVTGGHDGAHAGATARAAGFPRLARHGSQVIVAWTSPGASG